MFVMFVEGSGNKERTGKRQRNSKLTKPLPTPPTVFPNPPVAPPTAPRTSPLPTAAVVSPTVRPTPPTAWPSVSCTPEVTPPTVRFTNPPAPSPVFLRWYCCRAGAVAAPPDIRSISRSRSFWRSRCTNSVVGMRASGAYFFGFLAGSTAAGAACGTTTGLAGT